MAKRSSLRASDADRDRVAERLHQAAVEGRILAHEFEERVAAALRARTYGDLDAVVADLPSPQAAKRPSRKRELVAAHPLATAGAVAVVAVMAFAVLALALAALSGIWIVLVVLAVLHRGGRHGGRHGRHGGRHGRHGGRHWPDGGYGQRAQSSRSGASVR